MPRPGFVLDVDRSTPPTMFWRGERLTTERLPVGSRVIYAAEQVPPVADARDAIADALENPTAGEPLRALLRPDMKLTIAFDNAHAPVPPAAEADSRQLIIEAILAMAARTQIDDVVLVAARGLDRRLSDNELRRSLGSRVYESFAPSGLLQQHDAEGDDLVTLGKTDTGEEIAFNKRVVESDLVVFASFTTQAGAKRTGGPGARLSGYSGAVAARESSTARLDALLAEHTQVFAVETVVGTDTFPGSLAFLQRREFEWNPKDRSSFVALSSATESLPQRVRRNVLRRIRSPHSITNVFAGPSDAVQDAVAATLAERHTSVQGQTDVVAYGVPYLSSYATNSIANPVLVASTALDLMFNAHAGRPLVREGGAAIIHHPTAWDFDTVRHPSYVDFFNEVLADTRDSAQIRERYENGYANDSWYRNLYRTGNAYHGVHPLHRWHDTERARKHLGGVIVVGGNTEVVRRLGFKPASTFQDALEMARDVTGSLNPSLTQVHAPPYFVTDVS